MLVEFLILLDVSLLALLSLLSLVEDKLIVPAVIVLLLELGNTVLGHLGLHILALALAGLSMLFEDLAVFLKRDKLSTMSYKKLIRNSYRTNTPDFDMSSRFNRRKSNTYMKSAMLSGFGS